jgi:hypothetical protein
VRFSGVEVPGPVSTLTSIVQARVRHVGQRLGTRVALFGCLAVLGVIFLVFALTAGTVALSDRYGLLHALMFMAGGALVLFLIVLVIMAVEEQRERRIAFRRLQLDNRMVRAAAMQAALPQVARLPGRVTVGLGLVAVGALLVLARRSPRPDDHDEYGE